LYYQRYNADIFILCFSLVNPASFDNVRTKWYSEIRSFNSDVPIILVGNKLDLREDQDIIAMLKQRHASPITFEQGMILAKEIKAVAYVECSALNREGVNNVFTECFRAVLDQSKTTKRHSKCVIS